MKSIGQKESFAIVPVSDVSGHHSLRFKVDVKAFNRCTSMISLGKFELGNASRYISGCMCDVTAEVLVSPSDLSFASGWLTAVKAVRDLEGVHGLDGMQIYDRAETGRSCSYEECWASQIKRVFSFASSVGKPMTTGLFVPTLEMLLGHGIFGTEAEFENNIFSSLAEINAHGGRLLQGGALSYWSCMEDLDENNLVYGVNLRNGSFDFEGKECVPNAVRPVALTIFPS